jgi:hypothetical protein
MKLCFHCFKHNTYSVAILYIMQTMAHVALGCVMSKMVYCAHYAKHQLKLLSTTLCLHCYYLFVLRNAGRYEECN